MVSVFPHRTQVDHTQRPRTRISLGDSEGAAVVQAVSSSTARALLRVLQTDPAPASDLAEAVDTSLQNVQYHLDRLCEVGLVEAVDTWYSARGRQMTVYAPTAKRLVVDFDEPSTSPAESPASE